MVLTPQIEHCEYELGILPTSLTFRAHNRMFERLLPLRDALTPDGRHVMEDMLGEIPQYDAVAAAHDQALAALAQAANALYSSLVKSAEFVRAFDEVAEEVRRTNERDVPSADVKSQWVGYIAADVVNDLPPDLNSMTSEWAIWNRGVGRFKALAPRHIVADLAHQKSQFTTVIEDAKASLFALRKRFSRQYDVPVAPIPGAGIEGPLD